MEFKIHHPGGRETSEFARIKEEARGPVGEDKDLVQVPWRGQGAWEKNV